LATAYLDAADRQKVAAGERKLTLLEQKTLLAVRH
jgi:hypothetical protein